MLRCHAMKSVETPVGIGIIGSGNRMRGVVQNLKKAAGDKIEIRAVYDPSTLAVEETQRLFGKSVIACGSEEELLTHPAISWVFIGSMNNQHKRHILGALAADKHVFAEKPLATTLEDCLAIRDAVAASDRTFALGLVLRYSRFYQKIREVVDSGVLGKLISFEFNETLGFNHGGYIFGNWRKSWELSGGHVLEKCCHDIDLANWFIGSLPVRAASFGGQDVFTRENAKLAEDIGPNAEGLPAYRGWKTLVIEVTDPFFGDADIFDNQVAILEYANGVRATFHTNCNAGIPERRMLFVGARAALRGDLVAGKLELGRIGWDSSMETLIDDPTDGHGGGDKIMGEKLSRTLLEGEPPYASVKEGLYSAITAFAIDQSVRENRIVDVRPLWNRAGIM